MWMWGEYNLVQGNLFHFWAIPCHSVLLLVVSTVFNGSMCYKSVTQKMLLEKNGLRSRWMLSVMVPWFYFSLWLQFLLSILLCFVPLVSFLVLENSKTYSQCHPFHLLCSSISSSCICSGLVWKSTLWRSGSEHNPEMVLTASSFPTCLHPKITAACHFICFFSAYSLILPVAWWLFEAGNSSRIWHVAGAHANIYWMDVLKKKIPLLVRCI